MKNKTKDELIEIINELQQKLRNFDSREIRSQEMPLL